MPEYSDKELVQLFKIQTKREFAFSLIVKKYQQRLYWHIKKIVILHEEADDVLQNTFVKIWGALDNFREDAQLYTWIYRIATNEALTILNQNKKKKNLSLYDTDFQLSSLIDEDEYFDGNEIERKLQKAILQLPEKQRIIFNMKYFDNMKYEEISEILETSVGGLKASYHHAVKKIELFLNSD